MPEEEKEEFTPYKLALNVKNKFGQHFDIMIICGDKDKADSAIIRVKKKKVE